MLVIEITYKKPLAEVEKQLQPHREFLASCYKAGKFLASGPQNPRTGGVIIALIGPAEAQSLIEQDPFYRHQLADYRVVEFEPVLHHPLLEGYV